MEEIYELLAELRPEFDFRNCNDFIEEGLLDSFDIVNIVSEIEGRYKIVIDALDIIPENFNSVDAIVKTIQKNGGSI